MLFARRISSKILLIVIIFRVYENWINKKALPDREGLQINLIIS
jgi:hypothetical protein